MWWIWAVDAQVPWPDRETNVDFNGRTFNLLPQTDENFASIAVEAAMDERDQVSKAVYRFLSVLCWVDGQGVRTLWSVGNPGWRQPTRRSPFLAQSGTPIRFRSNFDFLPIPKDEKAAKALAFHRMAVSSQSPDDKFLQFFRIIELAHGRKKAMSPTFVAGLIDGAALQGKAFGAVQELKAAGLNTGKQIVIYGRHAIAHGDDEIAIDPDIVSERALLFKLMPILETVADHTIEEHFGIPSRQTYYRHHEYEVEGLSNKLSDALRAEILNSVGKPPVAIEPPVRSVTVGLRNDRYAAFTDLVVSQSTIREGGVLLTLQSSDGLIRGLVSFDLVNRRLHLDVERGMQIADNGTSLAAEYIADFYELLLGLVQNGELHVWDADTGDLLGREDPNLPVNIDPTATHALLSQRIAGWRAKALERSGTESK